jgi:hypothetical protein
MANLGAYREPGPVPGLPLPRRGLVAFTVVLAMLGLLAVVTPLSMLVVAGHSAAGGWRIFRDGGASMWLLLLCDFGAPVGLTVLGAFVLRGWRTPAVLLFVGAALPFAFALLGAWSGQRMTLGALSGESVDPEQRARILAEGIAESMSTDIFGGFVVCGVALVAAVAAASAVASIDVGRITQGGPKPPAYGLAGAAVAGGAWFVATIALAFVRARTSGTGVFFVAGLPLLVLVPLAALAGRGAAVLKGWHDRAEASRAAGAIVVAALSALLAVLALERALDASLLSRALEAIAGESVDDAQRARILAEGVGGARLAWVGDALAAVFGVATFGLALAPAFGGAANPATPSALVAGALGALLVGSTFALAHSRMSAPAAMAARSTSGAPAGVNLPAVVDTFSRRSAGSSYGTQVVLMKDGTGTGDPAPSPASPCPEGKLTLYADRAATVGMLRMRLPRVWNCAIDVVFVATRDHPPELDRELGPLAAFLGHTAYFELKLDAPPGATGSGRMLEVRTVADDAVEIDGTRVALPLPAGTATQSAAGSLASERIGRIHYTLRPADTIEEVVRAIEAAETLHESRIDDWELARIVTIDDGTGPGPAPSASVAPGGLWGPLSTPGPTVRLGPASVKGRLPPEVVERIVRQNLGRFRMCYQQGLRANPALGGQVAVKFVVDGTGTVSKSADAGSDLADRSVVACVVRSFSNLSFPAPEGGVVSVSYAISFAPPP